MEVASEARLIERLRGGDTDALEVLKSRLHRARLALREQLTRALV